MIRIVDITFLQNIHRRLYFPYLGRGCDVQVTGIREPDMLTGMTEQDWLITLEVFDAAQSNRESLGMMT